MRLEGKTAVIIGAGQTVGETIGNGRATALVFAREGANVLAVDVNLESATETVELIRAEGGTAEAIRADAARDEDIGAAIAACMERWGRVDVLHHNVGIGLSGGDASIDHLEPEAFDRIMHVNLRSFISSCQHVLPIMREQQSGSIITISSVAAYTNYIYTTYKASKAALIALMRQVAIENAPFGVRANCILPGLMNTPMAIEPRIGIVGADRAEVVARRDAEVPLRGKMGSGWDVANAGLFFASDESSYVTGAVLPVDGGILLKMG